MKIVKKKIKRMNGDLSRTIEGDFLFHDRVWFRNKKTRSSFLIKKSSTKMQQMIVSENLEEMFIEYAKMIDNDAELRDQIKKLAKELEANCRKMITILQHIHTSPSQGLFN